MASSPLRTRLLALFVVLVALLFTGRLYVLQVVDAEKFQERSERQHLRADDSFDRGSIYFSDQRGGTTVGAATVRSGFLLALEPDRVEDPEGTYEKINAIVSTNKDAFLRRAGKRGDPYEEVLHRLDDKTAKKIEDLHLLGVTLRRERWRFYPGERLAAHTVGFVGYGDQDFGGRYGLERYYDDVLRRRQGVLYRNFFAELFGDVRDAVGRDRTLEGDVVTTIEPTVEAALEKELLAIEKAWRPAGTGGIIMDPASGAIYALAALPTFDLNSLSGEVDASVFSNPLVERVFEMGSVMKPITMAIGIDTEAVTPESTYRDEGFLVLDGKRIENFDGKGRGVVSMQEVLNQSLNIGAAEVMRRVGRKRFSEYFKKFGFGEETGIDLPGELPGLVKNLESKRDIEHATASYGQGIALTPVAFLRAFAALANDGKLPNPHLLARIDYRLGFSKKFSPGDSPQVVSEETAEEVTRMLVTVVDKALLGGSVRLPHTSVAAKTGTAEIARPGGGGYYEDRFLHSFIGYFPAFDPKFIIFLYVREPQGALYAANTLTEPFMSLVQFLINYYNIPPDR